MSNTEIYVVLGVFFFLTGFTGLVIYRECLTKLSPNRTVLRRDYHDIELQDVIQPARDLDLSSLPEFPTSQAVINQLPVRLNGNYVSSYSISGNSVPGYSISGNSLPGYSVSGNSAPRYSDYYINCVLENNINFKIIFLILIVIVILWIIWKKYLKMIIKIRILWILIFIFIMNSLIHHNSIGEMVILFLFSLFKIDFRDTYQWNINSLREGSIISYLKIQTLSGDIESLLNSLKDDVNYSMSLSFISSYKEWKDNKNVSPLFISDDIIVNIKSNSILITQHIMDQLDEKGYFISNWLFKDDFINKIDSSILKAVVPISIEI